MIPLLEISSSDRILIFAPHPDDESLGAGGLIQHAVQSDASVRVVFVTNGDRNPWPQRVKERRWSIGPAEQARWGARRQREAIVAMARLGLPEESAGFFNWPDQGVTSFLLQADEEALGKITAEIEAFQPTLLVLPSPEDTHPDHSAFYVMTRLAMSRLSERGWQCPQLTFVIHAPSYPVTGHKMAVALNAREVQVKRDAIQCHETQMLSRRRFLAHAKPLERFRLPVTPGVESATHPIRSASFSDGGLRLRVELPALRAIGDPKLHIALESLTEGSVRWTLALPHFSGRVRLRCARTGKLGRYASVRMKGRMAEISIPVWSVQPVNRAYVKLDCRPLFFDVAGWHETPVVEATAPNPAFAPGAFAAISSLHVLP